MTVTELTIRIAIAGDLEGLARLNELFNGVSEKPETLRRRLADPQCVETPIVARLGDRVVGFAALRVVPCVFYASPNGELTELYVEEAYRGQGIAKKLVMYAENLAKDQGVEELILLTGPSNTAALALYHRLGYEDRDVSLTKVL
jgi:ribosomal protein S18 acetylase RimI-like enzyme